MVNRVTRRDGGSDSMRFWYKEFCIVDAKDTLGIIVEIVCTASIRY